ncbi:MAG TPA: 3-phosphoshikimate 1-carboxyvinyltransferase [Pirellulaceae bacterium]|nr:3-phosphoshikimate 1-carboxyvinyltransferase [Pirellulaceae bacterium]HMO93947.1 3-phosphoshikimate 1-carboxyvinyltransferase [Pirellulaceae bacterium]HMP67953.1 3-phosphoshikimate 1-carboxyvinyltransferase [Pirellulaceae bacterium]
MNFLEIQPSGPIHGVITPPGSKSITNRALVCAALAEGESVIKGALACDDTGVMLDSLRRLGIAIETNWDRRQIIVQGCGGQFPVKQADLFVGNSGTTMRFLTAMCAVGRGRFRLSGVPRMHQRPIGPLVELLSRFGVQISTENVGCPPVVIDAQGIRGGSGKIRGGVSSQFTSAVLMALPYADEFSVIQLIPPVVSKPYIDITCAVMSGFGVNVVRFDEYFEYSVDPQQKYDACEYVVEPDASAASYFWGAAAVTGGKVKVQGLTMDAMQGDVKFVKALEKMGCVVQYFVDAIEVQGPVQQGIEIDMRDISDTAQTLAVIALFAEGPTTIRGIAHNRDKETDRIGNLAIELRKLGAEVSELDDGLLIVPPRRLSPATIRTYDDHRMAMSFSLAGLRQMGIVIEDPQCVSKTYPEFFTDLDSIKSNN